MADPFYNSTRWQNVRRMRLQTDPLCVPCRNDGRITPATVVDHRVDRKTAPNLAFDLTNLVSMCVSCHSQKTARGPEAGAVRTGRKMQPRKGCDEAGNPIDPAHPWNVGGESRPSKTARYQTAAPLSTQLVSKKD